MSIPRHGTHRWTDEDDATLMECVSSILPKGRLHRRADPWHAVSGLLAVRGICVSPGGCARRYDRLVARTEEEREARRKAEDQAAQEAALRGVEREVLDAETPEEAEDAWARIEQLVEEHEQNTLDRIEAAVEQVGRRLLVLEGDVAALLREWRGA